jgi:hypothetical protein
MGVLNFLTRKKKTLQTKYPNVDPVPNYIPGVSSKYKPRSPERQKFFKKFANEIVNIWAPKPTNPVNRYVERNYETEASSYLRKLYIDLNQANRKDYINKKLREFQRNAHALPLSPEAKQIVESKLKKLRIYNQLLQNTNTNTRRLRASTRKRFSSNLSNTSTSSNLTPVNSSINAEDMGSNSNSNTSLPSLQSLRNNTRNYEEEPYRPRRRLQGRVIKSNQGRPPLGEA